MKHFICPDCHKNNLELKGAALVDIETGEIMHWINSVRCKCLDCHSEFLLRQGSTSHIPNTVTEFVYRKTSECGSRNSIANSNLGPVEEKVM